MKTPRDISGEFLADKLKVFGYLIVRQSGSHIRLTTHKNGEHHITIPRHNPLKIGTLSEIIKDIANHLSVSKEDIIKKIIH
ncbi:MAG: type II toxin-antitoxin system HicA family toxin [Candidatus Kapaibacterium sp.]